MINLKKQDIYQQNIELFITEADYHSNPTNLFKILCENKKNTLLLESVTVDKKNNLESILIIKSSLRIICFKQQVTLFALSENGETILEILEKNIPKNINYKYMNKSLILYFPPIKFEIDEEKKIKEISVFDSLRIILKSLNPLNHNSRSIFFAGLFSYNLISTFEPIKRVNENTKSLDFCFYLSEILLILDHQKKNCMIQGNLITKNINASNKIKKQIRNIKKIITYDIQKNIKYINDINNVNCLLDKITIYSNKTDQEYLTQIKKMKQLIASGEIFQIVISREFYLPCFNAIQAYYQLKINNPSPYMFFMQDLDFTLFGASPESALKFNPDNKEIEIYPIAGTKPRSKNKDGSFNLDLDSKIELEMRMNTKELSEHIMLVDLARNDLAKICLTGTRSVVSLMKVDKYSHVMHLVSKVTGILKSKLDIFHAYQACMNMGTLTGAPKIRAMQLISEEKEDRITYGGSIGYFTGNNNLDTCIIIRSAYVKNNIATIQSGVGIVFDSIPTEEIIESKNKALAVISSILSTIKK